MRDVNLAVAADGQADGRVVKVSALNWMMRPCFSISVELEHAAHRRVDDSIEHPQVAFGINGNVPYTADQQRRVGLIPGPPPLLRRIGMTIEARESAFRADPHDPVRR